MVGLLNFYKVSDRYDLNASRTQCYVSIFSAFTVTHHFGGFCQNKKKIKQTRLTGAEEVIGPKSLTDKQGLNDCSCLGK